MTDDGAALRERLLHVIRRGADHVIDDAEFNDLALAVFAHQHAANPTYRAYCDSRGASPDDVASWLDIPAVPTDAFKATALVAGDPAHARAVFRTSGTTAGRERRGSHYFMDLALYDAALRKGFEAAVLSDGARLPILSLVPPAHEQPDSSLSHMISGVVAEFGAGGGWYVSAAEGMDLPLLLAALGEAERVHRPVLLVGTSLAFVHLFEELERNETAYTLPEGSRAMDTGGFKGVSREVARAEVLERFSSNLGIPADRVVNEYGMTELSSQLYATGAGAYHGPGWMRTRAVDPETLAPLPDGETGILRHWDLANLDSVAVLQTADLGRSTPAGIELMGRAPAAEARGCSIAMDELLSALKEE